MRTDRLLLVFGTYFKTSTNVRPYHIARHLAEHFSEADLLSLTKMYEGPSTDPVWKKGTLGLASLTCHRIETIQSGNIVQLIVRVPHRPVILDSLLQDFWIYVNLRQRLKEHYDVCVFAQPRNVFVASRLKRLGKVDLLVYDDWDYFPALRPTVLFWRQVMRLRERICLQIVDGIVSVSQSLQELRRKQGARQTALVRNGVDYDLFLGAQSKRPYDPTLLYIGTLGEAWGADLPISAMPIIRKQIPEARYMLLGPGPEKSRRRALVTNLGLGECVHFCDMRKHRDVPRALAEADIGVVTSRDTGFRRYSCPLKIIEFMAGGLPVVGTRVGETQAIIEEARAGETVEFSPEAFASAAPDLLSNRGKYEQYSANAVAFARKHDWERLVDQAVSFMRQLA